MKFWASTVAVAAVQWRQAIADENSPQCDIYANTGICLQNGAHMILPPASHEGLEARYTFDESNLLDSSGNGNHGSAIQNVSSGIGGAGSAALFRKNHLTINHAKGFESSDFTYTFFLYRLEDEASKASAEKHDEYCPIVHKGVMTSEIQEASPAILINPKNGHLKVVLGTSASYASVGEEMESNATIRPNQWYHVAVKRNLNSLKLYVDGILDSDFTTEGVTRNNDMPIHIGGAPYAHQNCDVPILMDNLHIYSNALDTSSIQSQSSIVSAGIEPSYLQVGCFDCEKSKAENSCSDNYKLCSKAELFLGGFQVAKKIWNRADLINASSNPSEVGLALCCSKQ